MSLFCNEKSIFLHACVSVLSEFFGLDTSGNSTVSLQISFTILYKGYKNLTYNNFTDKLCILKFNTVLFNLTDEPRLQTDLLEGWCFVKQYRSFVSNDQNQ